MHDYLVEGLPYLAKETEDGTFHIRCHRWAHGGIQVPINHTFTLTDKKGRPKLYLYVEAFVQRIKYGAYTRSGYVVGRVEEAS